MDLVQLGDSVHAFQHHPLCFQHGIPLFTTGTRRSLHLRLCGFHHRYRPEHRPGENSKSPPQTQLKSRRPAHLRLLRICATATWSVHLWLDCPAWYPLDCPCYCAGYGYNGHFLYLSGCFSLFGGYVWHVCQFGDCGTEFL